MEWAALAFYFLRDVISLQLLLIRCDIFCTLIDVLLIYMVLKWCDRLSLLSLIKVNYHIATATLPVVSCTDSLPLIHHDTSTLKCVIRENICASMCVTRNINFCSSVVERCWFGLPSFHSRHNSPIFLWWVSSALPSVFVIWVGLMLTVPQVTSYRRVGIWVNVTNELTTWPVHNEWLRVRDATLSVNQNHPWTALVQKRVKWPVGLRKRPASWWQILILWI